MDDQEDRYATKDNLRSIVSRLKGIFVSTETDPTVPSWAKASSKPTYTAQEVGALPSSTQIPAAGSSAPKVNGNASAGASTKYAREDHIHPTDTTRASASDLSSHVDDTTVHITAAERTAWNGKTSNAGTVTKVSTGAGLTGGSITGSGTIKADLRSETKSSLEASDMGDAASRQYAVGLDKNGDLSVNVPWVAYSSATTSANGLMSSADKTKVDNVNVAFATCSSAADAQAKVATVTSAGSFQLKAGAIVFVKFAYNNTFSATADAHITLDVNGTGAKVIYGANSGALTGTNTTYFGRANYINQYVYDGTYWVWLGASADNNNTYSNMSSAEMKAGTATTARSISAACIKEMFASWCDNDTIKVNSAGKLYVALPSLDSTQY